MNQDFKDKLKIKFKEMTGREPSSQEYVNMETDQGLIQKVLIDEVETNSKDIKKLKP